MKTPVERISLRKRLALEVSRQVRENNKKLHPLRQLFWECTQRCNIHCKHCGSDCKSTAEIPDMPAADFLRVIDSLTPHVNPHEVNIILQEASHWSAKIWRKSDRPYTIVAIRGAWLPTGFI